MMRYLQLTGRNLFFNYSSMIFSLSVIFSLSAFLRLLLRAVGLYILERFPVLYRRNFINIYTNLHNNIHI